jgi:hypothetical protein
MKKKQVVFLVKKGKLISGDPKESPLPLEDNSLLVVEYIDLFHPKEFACKVGDKFKDVIQTAEREGVYGSFDFAYEGEVVYLGKEKEINIY